MKQPVSRNLCPYQILDWNKVSNVDRFTKGVFLESNPNIWDIREWNEDNSNERIIIK